MVPANAGPNVLNRPHSITADVEIPKGGADGVLVSAGDVQGGYSFFVQGSENCIFVFFLVDSMGHGSHTLNRTSRYLRDDASCASNLNRRVNLTSLKGKVRLVGGSFTLMESWSVSAIFL